MGLNLSFFKTPKHRVFSYQPLYYDERKEALKEKIEKANRKKEGIYVPGESIKGSFKRTKIDSKRSKGYTSIKRYITLLALIAFMVALIYFTKFFGLLI